MGTPMSRSIIEVKFTQQINRVVMLVGIALLMCFGSAHAEGSIKAGATKARACQVCHGKGGHSTKETYPVLAGQHAAYIRKQLHAFRAGTRKDPIMNSMAAPLSDQDIEDVAAFFHSNGPFGPGG